MNRSKSKSKSKGKTGKSTSNNILSVNKTSNSRKISQKKSSGGKNRSISKDNLYMNPNIKSNRDLTSPKTIEYSKMVEKYGSMLKDNSPKMRNDESDRKYDYSVYKSKFSEEKPRIENEHELRISGKSHNNNKYSSITEYEKLNIKSENSLNHKNQPLSLLNAGGNQSKNNTKNRQNSNNSNQYNYEYTLNNNSINENDFKIIKHENEILREENLNLKRLLEREKCKSSRLVEEVKHNSNVVNISELEELKDKIRLVERENEDLKTSKNEFTKNCQERLSLFIKLCRKYVKKIKSILLLFSKLETSEIKKENISESKGMILSELNQTIEKFNSTIHSPQLVKSLLDLEKNSISNLTPDQECNTDEEGLVYKKEFQLVDSLKKIELKLKKSNEDNLELQNKYNELQAHSQISLGELSDKNEEVSKLKRKLNDEKINKEETEASLQYSKQLNKDLESKLIILEEENSAIKKSLKSINEKLKEFDLIKNKKINLENEVKYKESIIAYLETLLESNNIKFNDGRIGLGLKSINFHENDEKIVNLEKKYTRSKLFYDEESDSEIQNYATFNRDNHRDINHNNKVEPISFNNLHIDVNPQKDEDSFRNSNKYDFNQSQREYRIKPSYICSPMVNTNDSKINLSNMSKSSNSKASKTSNLKNEIDNLDGEIKHLQNKLRIMIDVNKK